jgi:AAA domain/Primase C terminal 2 (PriCT-2)
MTTQKETAPGSQPSAVELTAQGRANSTPPRIAQGHATENGAPVTGTALITTPEAAAAAKAAALDVKKCKLHLTIFKDAKGNEKFKGEYTLLEWRDRIAAANADSKGKLFLLQGAVFGDLRSKKKSYRTNINVQLLTAVVVEHDTGEIEFATAVDTVSKNNLRALLYTSPSHQNGKARWRVIFPLSDHAGKDQHGALVAMANGLFGGKLAPESFTLSQSYYFGSVNRNPDHQAVIVDGKFLDLETSTLYRHSIYKDGRRVGEPQRQQTSVPGDDGDTNPYSAGKNREPVDRDEVAFALNQLSPDCPYRPKVDGDVGWMAVGAALASALDYDDGFDLFKAWSAKSEKYDEDGCKEKWKDFSEMDSIHISTLFHFANKANPDWRQEWQAQKQAVVNDAKPVAAALPPPTFRFLSSAEFVKDFTPPDYLWDGALLRGFVYSLTANTGHGKTAVMLSLTYSVASGTDFAGREVTQGRVLYFAGENPDDVRMRWIAMAEHLGFDADSIAVNFIPGTFDISKLEKSIRAKVAEVGGVVLVIIDTSPAYFHGDDENANVAMIQHAQMLYRLKTLPGSPTVLAACHPVKNAGKDSLIPRGGGGFLNALDGNMTAWREETTVAVHHQGKFRGVDFEPISFELVGATAKRLVDSKGRQIPTVIANALSKEETKQRTAQMRTDEDDILILLLEAKQPTSLDDIARALNWWVGKNNTPYKQKVSRTVGKINSSGKVKLIAVDRDGAILTKDGIKAGRKADEDRRGY